MADSPAFVVPLLAPWTRSGKGFTITREKSEGPPRDHFVSSFAQITTDGATYWSLLVEDGPEHYLRPRDIDAIENAFRVDRLEIGGRNLVSPAPSADRAIAEVLVALRAPLLESFVPKLLEGLDRALAEGDAAPLASFLTSDASHADAVAWLAQALVGSDKEQTPEPIWNPSAREVLSALAPDGATIELEAVRPMLGYWQVAIVVTRGESEAGVLVESLGRAAVRQAGEWLMVDLPEGVFELVDQAGHHLSVDGDPQSAIELLERAAEIGPLGARGDFCLGTAYAQVGRAEEAIVHLERAEPALPGKQKLVARHNRAAMCGRLGNGDQRVALEKENTDEFPDEPHAWYCYALASVQEGRFDTSIAAAERLLAMDADHANGHYTIACAYALRGPADDEKVFAHVAKAIALDEELREGIAGDSDFERVREDPRFTAALSTRSDR